MVCRFARAGLCSVWRASAPLLITVALALSIRFLAGALKRFMGLGLPGAEQALFLLVAPLAEALVAAVAAYITRSLIVGLVAYATIAAYVLTVIGAEITPRDVAILTRILAVMGGLAGLVAVYALSAIIGGFRDSIAVSLDFSRTRPDPTILALSALSVEIFWYTRLWPAGIASIPHSIGVIVAVVGALLVSQRLHAYVLSILVGAGWPIAVVAFSIAALQTGPPRSCRGHQIRGVVASTGYTTAARSGVRVDGPAWSLRTFECTKPGSTGAVPVAGGEKLVLWVYGSSAREALDLVIDRGSPVAVLCLGCDPEFWSKRYRLPVIQYTLGETVAEARGPGFVLSVQDRPEDYAFSAASLMSSMISRERPFIVIDSLDAIGRRSRFIESIIEELLRKSSTLAAISSDHEIHGMGVRPRIRGAQSAILASGLRDRGTALSLLEGIVDRRVINAVVDLLLKPEYAMVYPTCGGEALLLRLQGPRTPPA